MRSQVRIWLEEVFTQEHAEDVVQAMTSQWPLVTSISYSDYVPGPGEAGGTCTLNVTFSELLDAWEKGNFIHDVSHEADVVSETWGEVES